MSPVQIAGTLNAPLGKIIRYSCVVSEIDPMPNFFPYLIGFPVLRVASSVLLKPSSFIDNTCKITKANVWFVGKKVSWASQG